MNSRIHLSDSVLVSMALRRTPPSRAGRAHAHLATCPRCAHDLSTLRGLHEHLARRWPEPSEGTLSRALALVAPRPPRRADWDRFRLARLVYDSRWQEAAHAVRATAATQHQVWRLPSADLDLRLEGPGVGAAPTLLGQILPRRRRRRAPASGTVWIVESGAEPRSVVLGSTGEFSLPAPRSERWALWLQWGPLRLRVVRR